MDRVVESNVNELGSEYSFLQSVEEILKHQRLDPFQYEALAYAIWDCNSIHFDERSAALRSLSGHIGPRPGVSHCVFLSKNSLWGFLRHYCNQTEAIAREILDSKHGIDFQWRLVNETSLSGAPSQPKGDDQDALFDNDPYGEIDLCLNSALEDLGDARAPQASLMVTAEYWLHKDIKVSLEFDVQGDLLRVRQDDSNLDSCALLMAMLQIEEDEMRAYWSRLRAAKAEEKKKGDAASSKKVAPPIDPFIFMAGNSALEAKRDSYYRKYHGIVGAFESVDPSSIEGELRAMEQLLSTILDSPGA